MLAPDRGAMVDEPDYFFNASSELLAVVDREGRVRRCNPAWSAALGRPADDPGARTWLERVDPAAREAASAALEPAWSGAEVRFEAGCTGADGRARWVEWSARGVDGLCYLRGRDRTDERELRAEVERQRLAGQRFRALADTTSDFVGIADLMGRAIYLNPAGLAMVGRTAQDAVGVEIAAFHPPEHAAWLAATGIPRAIESGVSACDGHVKRDDGSLIPISQVIVALRDESGALESLATIIRDLSAIDQFKALEQQLRGQQAALRDALTAMGTPILPITEHIVVMPLVGALDPQRAEQFFEAALHGAQAHRARVVIIDVTGAAHVDAGIAGTLVRTAKALRLLGAQVVLTGIHPAVARALVDVGAELEALIPHGTLQSGFRCALGLVGERSRHGAA
jgi:rsbT co-antagonist protein RsbR